MTKVSPCSPAAPLLFVDTLDRPEYTYTHEVRIQPVGNIIKYLHVPYLRKQYTKSVCIYRRYLIFERGKIMDSAETSEMKLVVSFPAVWEEEHVSVCCSDRAR
jgi:hypothetical protein